MISPLAFGPIGLQQLLLLLPPGVISSRVSLFGSFCLTWFLSKRGPIMRRQNHSSASEHENYQSWINSSILESMRESVSLSRCRSLVVFVLMWAPIEASLG
jgi:hypothetical protein